MAFSLGEKSMANLVGVHPRMVAVVKRAIQLSPVDFKVIEGVRTLKRQKELYAQGRTKPGNIVTWTLNSNHFAGKDGFGRAVDLLPAPYDWKDTAPFMQVYKAMMLAATELNTPIRWGGDWDRDGNLREKGESDSPHFELWGI